MEYINAFWPLLIQHRGIVLTETEKSRDKSYTTWTKRPYSACTWIDSLNKHTSWHKVNTQLRKFSRQDMYCQWLYLLITVTSMIDSTIKQTSWDNVYHFDQTFQADPVSDQLLEQLFYFWTEVERWRWQMHHLRRRLRQTRFLKTQRQRQCQRQRQRQRYKYIGDISNTTKLKT